jgi:peptidoglycan/LPS O-acetylase OafA/YrhL
MENNTLENLLKGNHVKFLDGVRGFAVSFVLLYHFFPKTLSVQFDSNFFFLWDSLWLMGWSGVDLFFVLSGFLITGILYKSKGKPNYFKNFYIRRILRIFPIYYLLLFVFLLAIPLIKGTGVSSDSIYYWLYISNFDTEFKIPIHPILVVAWSLSIEEQYYLFYPAMVYFLNYKRWVIALAILILISVSLRFVAHYYGFFIPRQMYHFTLAHFDGIALGGLIRLLLFQYKKYHLFFKWYLRLLPVFIIIGISIALYCSKLVLNNYSESGNISHISYRPEMYLFGYFFNSLCYGGIILWCVFREDYLYKIFNNNILTTIGKYSYAMYLFQYIAKHSFDFINNYINIKSDIISGIIVFIICFLMAKLSWIFFEGPINNLKDKFTH